VTNDTNHKKGRPLISDKPMTAAERQQRHRDRLKRSFAALTLEQQFRLELVRFIERFAIFHPDMQLGPIYDALEKCGIALLLDAWRLVKQKHQDEICRERLWRAYEWDKTFGPFEPKGEEQESLSLETAFDLDAYKNLFRGSDGVRTLPSE